MTKSKVFLTKSSFVPRMEPLLSITAAMSTGERDVGSYSGARREAIAQHGCSLEGG